MAHWSGAALAIVAALVTIWVVFPAIALAIGFVRLRCDVREDPASAEPPANDPDYERCYQQCRELGFVPVGSTLESGWFFTPLDWYKRLPGSRWLASVDRRTFISMHRMIPEEPVRFGACTIFEGGRMLRTSCPGAGMQLEEGEYRRFEMRQVGPAALLAAHGNHVESCTRKAGWAVKAATMTEVALVEVEHERRFVLTTNSGKASPQFALFGIPALIAFMLLPRSAGSPSNRLALALIIAGALFAFLRFVVVKASFRQRALQSHSEDISDKKDGAS